MAAFHAHFWHRSRLDALDWVDTRFSPEQDDAEETESFRDASRVFVQLFRSDLSEEQTLLINRIGAEYTRLKRAVADGPLTLTHGDWTRANLVWHEAKEITYVVDWAGICKGSFVWDIIKFLDFELDEEVVGAFLGAYSESLNRDKPLLGLQAIRSRFHLAQAWYVCGTIAFIASIKEEHLRDPGTEWIREFVSNRQVFAHLLSRLVR
jgi:Ser/Thr protein kinase RdoA (MazF antagonist)